MKPYLNQVLLVGDLVSEVYIRPAGRVRQAWFKLRTVDHITEVQDVHYCCVWESIGTRGGVAIMQDVRPGTPVLVQGKLKYGNLPAASDGTRRRGALVVGRLVVPLVPVARQVKVKPDWEVAVDEVEQLRVAVGRGGEEEKGDCPPTS
ncbi:MAG: hypothetical protein ONB52_22000 [candidate division KSB1 bacterium]|nr:hypothetical protein [candidate division KSB1 bacterium]